MATSLSFVVSRGDPPCTTRVQDKVRNKTLYLIGTGPGRPYKPPTPYYFRPRLGGGTPPLLPTLDSTHFIFFLIEKGSISIYYAVNRCGGISLNPDGR